MGQDGPQEMLGWNRMGPQRYWGGPGWAPRDAGVEQDGPQRCWGGPKEMLRWAHLDAGVGQDGPLETLGWNRMGPRDSGVGQDGP